MSEINETNLRLIKCKLAMLVNSETSWRLTKWRSSRHQTRGRYIDNEFVMNQLRAWLYGHNGYAEDKQRRGKSLDIDEPRLEQTDRYLQERNGQQKSTRDKTEGESVLRSALLRVIPLAPGDCLECKLVGTGVMMLSGGLVMMSAFTAKRRNPSLSTANNVVYYLLCGSLFLGFEMAAFCRLFDVGPFEKYDQNTATKATKQ